MNNSTFTGKRTQCPKCAASGLDNKGNNFAEYTDHWYCFACQHYEGKDGINRTMETDTTFTSTEFKPTKGTLGWFEFSTSKCCICFHSSIYSILSFVVLTSKAIPMICILCKIITFVIKSRSSTLWTLCTLASKCTIIH